MFIWLGLCCWTWAFPSCGERGLLSGCGVWAYPCGVWAYPCGASSLPSVGSGHSGFSSCGPWLQLPHSMWDLPGPGIESLHPALAGGFLAPGPQGSPVSKSLVQDCLLHVYGLLFLKNAITAHLRSIHTAWGTLGLAWNLKPPHYLKRNHRPSQTGVEHFWMCRHVFPCVISCLLPNLKRDCIHPMLKEEMAQRPETTRGLWQSQDEKKNRLCWGFIKALFKIFPKGTGTLRHTVIMILLILTSAVWALDILTQSSPQFERSVLLWAPFSVAGSGALCICHTVLSSNECSCPRSQS